MHTALMSQTVNAIDNLLAKVGLAKSCVDCASKETLRLIIVTKDGGFATWQAVSYGIPHKV